MNRWILTFTVTILAWSAVPMGNAQATRTWVSGVGDDANPCSRTAPCKTFAGAISKTSAGGEISALDPGGFGGVTITKSITLNGDGNLTSLLVSSSPGVTINAQPTDVVVLRHLSINGTGTGTSGVRMVVGGMLVVDSCSISGFTQNGIEMATSGVSNLVAKNTTFTGGSTGVRITSGMVNASLHDITVSGAVNGIYASSGTVDVSKSVISQNTGVGVLADGTSTISLESNMLTGNATAAQAITGATIRLSNNDIFDNSIGFGCGGGILASSANNRKAGNTGGGAVCSPTVMINVQ
jgi:Right handed beta helix region